MKSGVFVVMAILLFIASGLTLVNSNEWQLLGGSSGAIAPNTMMGLGALGFAIAGGMSLMAAAITSLKKDDSR